MNNLGTKIATGVIFGVSVGVGIVVIRNMIQNRFEVHECVDICEVIEEES